MVVVFNLISQFFFLLCYFVCQILEFIHGKLQVTTAPVDNMFQVDSYLLDCLFVHKL